MTNSRPRQKEASTWRRHYCAACQAVFTTEERPALDSGQIVKTKNGNQVFSVGKLTLSIARAFIETRSTADSAYQLARSVEQRLLADNQKLTSNLIASATHLVLESYNKPASLIYQAQHRIRD